jgi:hypothetical protein
MSRVNQVIGYRLMPPTAASLVCIGAAGAQEACGWLMRTVLRPSAS